MAYNGIIDFILHFDSFKNIELTKQGIYSIRSALFHKVASRGSTTSTAGGGTSVRPKSKDDFNYGISVSKKQNNESHSYKFASCTPLSINSPESSDDRVSLDHLQGPQIFEENYFQSKVFVVRYSDEEITLNETCEFRLELDAQTIFDKTFSALFLQIDLLFNEISQCPKPIEQNLNKLKDLIPNMELVNSQTFQLRGFETEFHQFVPVLFDENYSSLAGLSVHSTLLDFRYRLRPLSFGSYIQPSSGVLAALIPESSKPDVRQPDKQTSTATSTFVDAMYYPPATLFHSRVPTNTLSHSITEEPKPRTLTNDVIGICNFYREAVSSLANSYSSLTKHLGTLNSLMRAKRLVSLEPSETKIVYYPALSLPKEDEGKSWTEFIKNRCAILKQQSSSGGNLNIAARMISQDLAFFAAQIYPLHKHLIALQKNCLKEVSEWLANEWASRQKEKTSQWVVRERNSPIGNESTESQPIKSDTLDAFLQYEMRISSSLADLHVRVSDSWRKNKATRSGGFLPIEDLSAWSKINSQPVFFISSDGTYIDESCVCAPETGVHLCVLVHGFQGGASDMKILKSHLSLVCKNSIFMSSKCNIDGTDGDIEQMGIRLAEEVAGFIADWCPGNTLNKLSFLGHSLGGLITRAALKSLSPELTNKLFSFVTLSSPHLGYLNSSSRIVDAGLWFLKKWRKSLCLQQLTLTDAKDFHDCCLFKLSCTSELNAFKHIALFSSHQDQYCPFESARIEISGAKSVLNRDIAYQQMIQNLLNRVEPARVTRIDVNFQFSDKSIDTFIGRAAHIQFLENANFMRTMLYQLRYLFD